jgi:thiol:disulfide interchange protein DsbD
MLRTLTRSLLAALLVALCMGAAGATESAKVISARATVSLVSDTDAVSPDTPFRIGLYIRLALGWHTYWKNPGDAGVPPDLELTLPEGSKAGPIAWPTPRRVAEGSLMTYAYIGDLLLPVSITPAPGAASVAIEAHAQWLVCKDICVPEEGDFRLDLPVGSASASAQAPLFAAFYRQAPRPSPWRAVVGADGTLRMQGPELTPATVLDAWFIPDTPGTILDGAAQPLAVWQGGFTLSLRPGKSFRPDAPLSGILAVRDRAGLETDVVVQAMPGAVPPPEPSMPLRRMLGLAFLGGLILNLMPCVFPVLALKAVSLAGAARGRMHAQALAYTLGVLVAFGGLGGALLAARAAGAAAGWGFQFQSPAFVAAMAWLLFAVGLNLSGVFQIGMGFAGTGQGLAGRGGQVGSFFTGLLAVVVATPCTAPFMGAAIAAGLAAPPAVTMLVFLVMGLGLATPYALLAWIPGLARMTPKPGRWMEVLRQALAFPMYGASAWLVWVISQEAGPSGVLGTVVGLVLLGFAAWVSGLAQAYVGRSRRVGQSAAAAALLAALAVLSGIATAPATPAGDVAEAGVEPFSAARLAALRAEGRPVFVNMTAAWCVTCLVNERVAISSEPVQRAFADHHVAYLKGDWTRQDPGITAYLRENGRDGVPLYVYYPARDGRPNVLPQILTENALLRELDRG